MTFNPILLALDTLGHDASLRTNMSGAGAATKELTSVLRRGLVALVPMKLAGGGGLTGNAVEDAIWCAIHQVSNEDTGYEAVRVHTPFGPMDMPMEDVVRRWRGPWTTLVPAGDGQYSATYAMVTVGARKETLSPLDVDVEILRNASAILNEPRSYAEAYGGFAAYEALMADLKRPAEDVSAAILWSGKPRQQLIASRILAAAYLREAAPNMPDAARTSVERAAALYDQVVTVLRDEWPLPEAKAFEGENAVAAVGDAAARRPHAIAALEEALSRERRAIALMEQAVADAVRAQ
ncbi:MAG TPA: hypothetical protein QGF05_10410, partial [Dehalococcoidia bacterium]|nr:hypothetical protein [Dehalococcoidia bacterium]